jgi:hypothetical protein
LLQNITIMLLSERPTIPSAGEESGREKDR